MKLKQLTLGFGTLAASTSLLSAATVYQIDLEKDTSSTTQSGWTSVTAPNSSGPSSLTSGSVTFTAGGAGGYFAGRAGGTWGAVNVTDADWNDLVGDTVAARSGDGTISISFTGLALGVEHQFTAWHNVSATDSASFSAGLYTITPSITTGTLVGSATSGAASNINKNAVGVVAADFNNSVINFTPDGSGNATVLLTSADATNHFLTFSGMQLESVPEPSSAALLGVGGLALVFRRRK
ncbi:MAG: PEP-CTERM sorting domain-containing protein [Akkermansiaceae bacterium]|nr:PEP-CTERM sorting domain-containing protein [Akkermansiaceae bacterium]